MICLKKLQILRFLCLRFSRGERLAGRDIRSFTTLTHTPFQPLSARVRGQRFRKYYASAYRAVEPLGAFAPVKATQMSPTTLLRPLGSSSLVIGTNKYRSVMLIWTLPCCHLQSKAPGDHVQLESRGVRISRLPPLLLPGLPNP